MLSGDNIRQGSKEQRDKDEKGKKHKEEKKHKTDGITTERYKQFARLLVPLWIH